VNRVRFFTIAVALAFVAGAITYSMTDDDGARQDESAVVIVTVTKGSQPVDAGANVTPPVISLTTDSPPAATTNVDRGPIATQASVVEPASRLQATGLESAVLDDESTTGSSEPPSSAPTQANSGAVAIDDTSAAPPAASATASTAKATGDPVEVGSGAGVQLQTGCQSSGENCTKSMTVAVSDGAGGTTVLGQGGSVAVASSRICSEKPTAEFHVNPDGSWSYKLDAGCVKKQGTSGP
jgi:hypothetical protein